MREVFIELTKDNSNHANKRWKILSNKIYYIGRSESNNIHQPHFSISRNHAKIQLLSDKDVLTFEDLNSENGSMVNEQLAEPNVMIKLDLNKSNVVILGDSKYQLTFCGSGHGLNENLQEKVSENESCGNMMMRSENCSPGSDIDKKKGSAKTDKTFQRRGKFADKNNDQPGVGNKSKRVQIEISNDNKQQKLNFETDSCSGKGSLLCKRKLVWDENSGEKPMKKKLLKAQKEGRAQRRQSRHFDPSAISDLIDIE